MSVTDLPADVSDELNTELSRLGSSKSLFADTEGNLEPDAVLAAMADAAHFAAEIADGWATDDDGSANTYESVAETYRDHYDTIAGDLDAHEPGERPAALDVLRGFERPVERLGGLLGWSLVAEKKTAQATGFFTGQADPRTASTFREFGTDDEETRGEVLDALDDATDDEDAVAQARSAAEQVVGAAYDEYIERLEAQGVNPKPVC